MAKRRKHKYEFRPDKQKSNFFNKLYMTQRQQRSLLKWLLYAAVLLVLSLIQDAVMSKIIIFDSHTDLVPLAILLICVVEGSDSGSLFILIASMLFVFSGGAPGAYAIAYLVIPGIGAAIFRQNFLRKGFSAAMLCTSVVFVAYEMLIFITGIFMDLTIWSRIISFLMTSAITFVTAPFLYPIVLSISKIGGETWKE